MPTLQRVARCKDSDNKVRPVQNQKVFDFEPVVLTGPKLDGGNTNIYLDTQNRRLYLIRSKQLDQATNESYLPSQIDSKKEDWKKAAKKVEKNQGV